MRNLTRVPNRFALLLLSLYFAAAAMAQQTQYFIDPEAAYRRGLELCGEKNYLSAREKFEAIYKGPKDAVTHTDEVMMQNIDFYIAVCATENNDKDAEKLLLGYISK